MNMKKTASQPWIFASLILMTGVIAHAQVDQVKTLTKEITAELPGRQKEIAEKCDGASPVVEVDFASFGENAVALQSVSQLSLKQTTNAFRRFCTDSSDTTKSDAANVGSLKANGKKIVLKHVEKAEDKKVTLQKGGIILIEMKFDKPTGGGIDYVAMARKLGELL
jgi:hypothetical protein